MRLIWQQAEKRKSLENSVFCRLSLYETVLGGLPVRVKSCCCCCCFFFVTMLQVLFRKPQHLTWVQEFANARFNSRTVCYLPNWVQVISFPKKHCTTKPWRWRGKPLLDNEHAKGYKDHSSRHPSQKRQSSMERLKAIVNNMRFQNRCDDFRRPKIHSWLV